jgi:hypothetical protein
VARLKLTEPVRLYLWPVAAVLLVSGLAGGLRDGDWWRASLFVAAALLVVLGAEAARRSVFSPCGAMAERVNAALNARLNR